MLLSTLERHGHGGGGGGGRGRGVGVEGDSSDEEDDDVKGGRKRGADGEDGRSPIAQMLWTRWVVGLKEQRTSVFRILLIPSLSPRPWSRA